MILGICIGGIFLFGFVAMIFSLAKVSTKTPLDEQAQCLRDDAEKRAARKRQRAEKRERRRRQWQS